MNNPVNLEFIQGIKAEIEGAADCDALQEAAAKAIALIQSQIDDATDKLAEFSPYLELLTLPTDPLKVLEYLEKLVDTLIEPIIKPVLGYQLQIAAYVTALTDIVAAIEEKASSFSSCAVPTPVIPPIVPPVEPPI